MSRAKPIVGVALSPVGRHKRLHRSRILFGVGARCAVNYLTCAEHLVNSRQPPLQTGVVTTGGIHADSQHGRLPVIVAHHGKGTILIAYDGAGMKGAQLQQLSMDRSTASPIACSMLADGLQRQLLTLCSTAFLGHGSQGTAEKQREDKACFLHHISFFYTYLFLLDDNFLAVDNIYALLQTTERCGATAQLAAVERIDIEGLNPMVAQCLNARWRPHIDRH